MLFRCVSTSPRYCANISWPRTRNPHDSSLAVHLHSPLNPTRRDDACRSRPAVRPLTRLSPAFTTANCLGIQKKN